ASVRPEPGSNSDVQSFILNFAPHPGSPKPFSLAFVKAFNSPKSDCFFFFFLLLSSLYRFQVSLAVARSRQR
ncbi:MAG: hypothetical protein PUI95_12110, partial [Eubacteriales bacterium]|nr:hypothetical protein [Eubacteriales bacterium]